jgi:hypothetical protein
MTLNNNPRLPRDLCRCVTGKKMKRIYYDHFHGQAANSMGILAGLLRVMCAG